jgi:hypothetical protein
MTTSYREILVLHKFFLSMCSISPIKLMRVRQSIFMLNLIAYIAVFLVYTCAQTTNKDSYITWFGIPENKEFWNKGDSVTFSIIWGSNPKDDSATNFNLESDDQTVIQMKATVDSLGSNTWIINSSVPETVKSGAICTIKLIFNSMVISTSPKFYIFSKDDPAKKDFAPLNQTHEYIDSETNGLNSTKELLVKDKVTA